MTIILKSSMRRVKFNLKFLDWENENKKGFKNNDDWDNNWEDQVIDENLEKQIKSEIEKFKNKIQINN